jgi:hypothetical protein
MGKAGKKETVLVDVFLAPWQAGQKHCKAAEKYKPTQGLCYWGFTCGRGA